MIHVNLVLSGGEQEARSEVSRDFPRDCANDERRRVACQGGIEERKGVRASEETKSFTQRVEHRVPRVGKKRDVGIEEKHETHTQHRPLVAQAPRPRDA
jgi:hypothetical protein